MLLGIQVTRTLSPKRRLVRRYARLMGSSTVNFEATDFVAVTMPFKGLDTRVWRRGFADTLDTNAAVPVGFLWEDPAKGACSRWRAMCALLGWTRVLAEVWVTRTSVVTEA